MPANQQRFKHSTRSKHKLTSIAPHPRASDQSAVAAALHILQPTPLLSTQDNNRWKQTAVVNAPIFEGNVIHLSNQPRECCQQVT